MELTTELFFVPYGEKFILYSPLKKKVFLVNSSLVKLISELKNGGNVSVGAMPENVLNILKQNQIIDGKRDKTLKTPSDEFKPTNVTLFPTSDCNLRCVYCFSDGGSSPNYMKWEYARAAIDFVISNALKQKTKVVGVNFHGDGEPTLAWDFIKKCVDYTRTEAIKNKLGYSFNMGTNGLLSKSQLEFIVNYFDTVTLSFDGPPEIHNKQRPLVNGEGSFKYVEKTVKFFKRKKFKFGIRPTVTQLSVNHLPEIVKFFYKKYKIKSIAFEPLFECGRCKKTKWGAPSREKFIENFKKASKLANKYGVYITYSAARVDHLKNKFCGAAGTNFFVTSEGLVTSCVEVTKLSEPRAKIFIYGKYDPKSIAFVFGYKKLKTLRGRVVSKIKHCNDCFAKYHCAGDCLCKIALAGSLDSTDKNPRCIINRELTKQQLIDLLVNKKRVLTVKPREISI